MKTTLEIPDPTFRKAGATASALRDSVARVRHVGS